MVTFLFTDIEGSTHRWIGPRGDAERPRRARFGAASSDRGLPRSLFKHTGDGICAAFASASDAITRQSPPNSTDLPVRMGLASGRRGGAGFRLLRTGVNRAARVMGAGHGGQILLAASTAELLDGNTWSNSGDAACATSPRRCRSSRSAAGLRSDFPPLNTVEAVPGNLPAQTTSFIGRDAEIDALADLMHSQRLVTFTGVGGVGKSGWRCTSPPNSRTVRRRSVVVELAPVGDPDAVPDAVASPRCHTASRDEGHESLGGLLRTGVADRVDNCEHVLDAAAAIAEAMLARATTVSLMATSRESLDIGAERTWPVPRSPWTRGRGRRRWPSSSTTPSRHPNFVSSGPR